MKQVFHIYNIIPNRYFIASGRVAAIVGGHQQQPMSRGHFFGEIVIVSNFMQEAKVGQDASCRRTADVVCLTNCDLLELKKDTVLAVCASAPKLAVALEQIANLRRKNDSDCATSTPAGGSARATSPGSAQERAGYTPLGYVPKDDYSPLFRNYDEFDVANTSLSPTSPKTPRILESLNGSGFQGFSRAGVTDQGALPEAAAWPQGGARNLGETERESRERNQASSPEFGQTGSPLRSLGQNGSPTLSRTGSPFGRPLLRTGSPLGHRNGQQLRRSEEELRSAEEHRRRRRALAEKMPSGGELPTELQFLKAAREAARIMKDVDPKKKWDTMQKLACGAVWGGY
jgi:hypothetical protein